ncbi:MAG: ATP-binding protein, partial [bacterium]|nr:ATP-binding protein [bacterium]
MARIFNTAGMCRPAKHYMLPPEARIKKLRKLIENETYFVIHAPRQTGKTTGSYFLAEALTAEGKYAALLASCKIASTAGADVERGIPAVIRAIDLAAGKQLPDELRPPPPEDVTTIEAEARFQEYLSRWCERCPR